MPSTARRVRPFAASDIPHVAALHLKVFPEGDGPQETHYRTREAYAGYLRSVFLEGPHRQAGFPSLVCEDGDGIIGFLGVVPVRMRVRGRLGWATCLTQFGVDPDRRGLAGLMLLREHLAGPQDLSFADECDDRVVPLWEWAGGSAVTLASLHFMRPLKPGRFALSFARHRPGLASIARMAAPAVGLMDAALARLPGSYFRRHAPATRGEELDAATMGASFARFAARREVAPAYDRDEHALRWRLARANGYLRRGPLRRTLVRDADGRVLGWFVAYFPRGEVGEVLQVVAEPKDVGAVLDHLCHDAAAAGVAGLSGRVDPALAQGYSDAYCLFSRRGPWTLVHSRDAGLVDLFHRGQVLVSRLEGEWCARFE
jgi:hypothetical protein